MKPIVQSFKVESRISEDEAFWAGLKDIKLMRNMVISVAKNGTCLSYCEVKLDFFSICF